MRCGKRKKRSMTAQVAFLKIKDRYGQTGLVVELSRIVPFGSDFNTS